MGYLRVDLGARKSKMDLQSLVTMQHGRSHSKHQASTNNPPFPGWAGVAIVEWQITMQWKFLDLGLSATGGSCGITSQPAVS